IGFAFVSFSVVRNSELIRSAQGWEIKSSSVSERTRDTICSGYCTWSFLESASANTETAIQASNGTIMSYIVTRMNVVITQFIHEKHFPPYS
ncbi:MAG: hypothetical protein PVI97_07420, partial [Candidatus Thiodiazotropha sp.]